MLRLLAGFRDFLIDCICNGGRGGGIDLDGDDVNVDNNGEIYGDI